ncbi:MAG TPA: hypothetical protein VLG47_00530, partial [Candidatus Saccharimonadales bacterium]|nr:hypothetical protein [Candidatus Saccharimonadales bacterium]
MIHNNSAPRLVLARNVLPWAQYPDAYTAAKNITDVSVANIVNVGSGELVRGEQYISAYWSARFKHCSALIMRSTVTIGFDFAHCWPDAQEILRPMQQ